MKKERTGYIVGSSENIPDDTNVIATAHIQAEAITGVKLATGTVRQGLADGAAAGAVAVTGIAVGDELISVLYLASDGAGSFDGMDDLTAEFTISDTDEIDNTDGTDTTNGFLVITWVDKT